MGGEAFVDGVVMREKKDKLSRVCDEMLQGIREFDVKKMSSLSLQEKIQEILKNSALDVNNFKILQKDEFLRGFIGHDLGNIASVVLGNSQVVGLGFDDDRKEERIELIFKYWPRYSLIIEDICLRGIDEKKIDKKYFHEFDAEPIIESMVLLEKGLHDKIADKIFRINNKEKLGRSPATNIISTDHRKIDVSVCLRGLKFPEAEEMANLIGSELQGVPGAVINDVNNIVRNAAGEYLKRDAKGKPILDQDGNPIEIGAENIDVSIFKEDDFVVFRVVDDGKGMPQDYLSEGSKNNIFVRGNSGRGSSGCGLADMPARLESMGSHLRVLTFERDVQDSQPAFFDSNNMNNASSLEELSNRDHKLREERSRISEQIGFVPSTVFEIRIPIVVNNF